MFQQLPSFQQPETKSKDLSMPAWNSCNKSYTKVPKEHRLVSEIAHEYGIEIRFQPMPITAIHVNLFLIKDEVGEYTLRLFEATNMCLLHAKTVIDTIVDIYLAMRLL
ncbi:histone H3 [Thelohanellus kitauei]|uniref:Histone H3 n=1 Tax=Thelohanellus kitauei TaxID=669202 RepID=A0A0C2JAC8_THEKT|nr:histone H3 [Thelohanellus kitauei]